MILNTQDRTRNFSLHRSEPSPSRLIPLYEFALSRERERLVSPPSLLFVENPNAKRPGVSIAIGLIDAIGCCSKIFCQ